MSGNDREPIGRRRAQTRPEKNVPRKRNERRRRDDDWVESDFTYDDEENSYQGEEMARTSNNKKKNNNRPPRKKRRFLWLLFKILIVVIVLVICYGFYLDSQIRTRLDGKVWSFPATVYGRVVNLEPGMPYSKPEMVNLLEGMQYRQVTKATRSGEFTVRGNNIELWRRAFDFPDGKEGQIQARLYFTNKGLDKIQNLENNREFGFFRLDPRLITMMQSPNGEQRLFVAREGFPDLLVESLLATEDRNFYNHEGVNPLSIIRAVLANLTAGRTVQGGSTLTQQLVKNLFLTNERSLWRKLNEAYMALILDYRYSKDRILELYLNEVFFGQSGSDEIRGFPLASLYYFGRPIDELSLDQMAMLVGMVKGASLYNPWRHPDNMLKRRNLVLKLMQNQQIIDQELYDMLSARPLGVQPRGGVISPQPAFMQLVRQELRERLGDKVDNLSGVKIFTTMDPVAQDAAEKAIKEGIPEIRKARKVDDLEAAMVIVDRFSGEIRAIVGGAEPQFAGFNRALQARRSIGSLAKPPTYLAALSQPDKYRLNTWLADDAVSVKIPGGKDWQPKNYDRRFRGQVMLVDALANSLNVPTVNLGMEIGLNAVTATWANLGVPESAMQPAMPSMLLGAISLTPIEVAQMYQTIASGGNRAKLSALRTVIGEDGTVVYQSYPQAERKVSAQAAYLTLYVMQQVVERGTARSLMAEFGKYHLAGKTGTTNDLRDSWYAGIDGKEVVITWVGRDNNEVANITGSNGALPLYRRYLSNQTALPLVLRAPEDMSTLGVDDSGRFVCSGGGRQLPVWTRNPGALCAAAQPQNDSSEDDVADWIKQMFSN